MNRYYSHLKFFHYTDHIDAVREGRIAGPAAYPLEADQPLQPRLLVLRLQRSATSSSARTWTNPTPCRPEKAMEVADDLVEMGVKAVTFSGGGEPLIYRPLPDVIERLATGGVKVASLTNGAGAQEAAWPTPSRPTPPGSAFPSTAGTVQATPRPAMWRKTNSTAWSAICAISRRADRTACSASPISSRRKTTATSVDMARLMKDVGVVRHVKFSGVVVGNDGASNNPYHAGMFDEVRAPPSTRRRIWPIPISGVVDFYHEIDDRFDKTYTALPVDDHGAGDRRGLRRLYLPRQGLHERRTAGLYPANAGSRTCGSQRKRAGASCRWTRRANAATTARRT